MTTKVVWLSLLLASGAADRRGGDGTLVTDRPTYAVAMTASEVRFDVGVQYTNHSEGRRYIPVCKRPEPPCVDRWSRREGWKVALCPVVPMCQDPAIVVEAGRSVSLRFVLTGYRNGAEPEFRSEQVSGTYRLRWRVYRMAAGRGRDAGAGPGVLEPDPIEVLSNSFTVKAPP